MFGRKRKKQLNRIEALLIALCEKQKIDVDAVMKTINPTVKPPKPTGGG